MRGETRFCRYCGVIREHEYGFMFNEPLKEILACTTCGRITLGRKDESKDKESGKQDRPLSCLPEAILVRRNDAPDTD